MVNFAASMAAAMPLQKIGVTFASCRLGCPDFAISTHLCSTTSPCCNNLLYLLRSLFLSFTRNSALRTFSRLFPSIVVVVPLPLRQLCLSAVEIHAFYTFFSTGHHLPSMAAIHTQNQFFRHHQPKLCPQNRPISPRPYIFSRGFGADEIYLVPTPACIPAVFQLLLCTLHFVLFLRRHYAIGSSDTRHK
jgi:hypothetical protein